MRIGRPEVQIPERRAENIARISARFYFLAVSLIFVACSYGILLLLLDYAKLHTISAAAIPEAMIILMLATATVIYQRLV